MVATEAINLKKAGGPNLPTRAAVGGLDQLAEEKMAIISVNQTAGNSYITSSLENTTGT